MINDKLDWGRVRSEFQQKGYVRIADILAPEAADQIHRQFVSEVPWGVKFISRDGPIIISREECQALPPEEWQKINQEVAWSFEHKDPSYFYYSAGLNEVNGKLVELVNAVSNQKFIGFIKYVSDLLDINSFGGQLTCYRRNCFLTRHEDLDKMSRRRVAFIFGFTRDWRTEWGGLLHMLDNERNIIDVFQPTFNTLTLFKVPRDHFVSHVVPYAGTDPLHSRYTMTGWYIHMEPDDQPGTSAGGYD
jgi:SM-20-related protein